MKHSILGAVCQSVLWGCVALAVVGCAGASDSGDKNVAVQKANVIYQAIKDKDFKKAAGLFSPKFYETTSPARWTAHLEDLHNKFGDLKRYELKKVITNSNYNGVNITLKYKTYYTKHDAFEEMTFATQPSGGRLEIMDYKVELDKFDS